MKLYSYKQPIVWGIVVLLVAILPAEWFDLYYRIKYLDKIFHFVGGFIVGWFFCAYFQERFIRIATKKAITELLFWVFIVGVLWEVAEYVSAHYIKNYLPIVAEYLYIGNVSDSIGDLVADIAGGVVFWLIVINNKIKRTR